MILRLFFLHLFIFSYIEPCVRTIPPEEVFITSTGANLPFTDEPDDENGGGAGPGAPATSAPATNAPATNAPGTMAPGTVAPVVTSNPVNQCTACDIDGIAPDAVAGATFTDVETEAAGACKMPQVTCERTDDQTCQAVGISATTANGPVTITDTSTTTSAVSTLTCAADGTYSYGSTATGITKLSCIFDTCESNLCTECDINSIAPADLQPEETFTNMELSPAGACKQTQITCGRSDNLVCTSEIVATTPTGDVSITDTSTQRSAVSTLTCAKDGTYSHGTTATGITKLMCKFTGCVPPSCTTCDINDIAPIITDPEVSFSFVNVIVSGCRVTNAICKRTSACQTVSLRATGSTGTVVLVSSTNTNSISEYIYCAADGTYELNTVKMITRLYCDYGGTCDDPDEMSPK